MKYTHKLVLLALVVVLAMTGIIAATAQEEAVQALPEVTVTSSADGLVVPEVFPDGLVIVNYDNQNEAPMLPVPARLNDDVTEEQFMDAIMAGGPEAALGLVALQGGTFVPPNFEYAVTYDLTAGRYVLLDFAAEAPSLNWFSVEDDGETLEIDVKADVHVTLFDFAFAIPQTIDAGDNVWHIENKGYQWHEVAITRIDENMSYAELREMLTSIEGGPEAPMPDFLWLPMAQGTQAMLNVNLEPGTYAVLCHLPDLMGMTEGEAPHSHAELGMLQIITVK